MALFGSLMMNPLINGSWIMAQGPGIMSHGHAGPADPWGPGARPGPRPWSGLQRPGKIIESHRKS